MSGQDQEEDSDFCWWPDVFDKNIKTDCVSLIFPGMGTLKYPRQSLVIFSFSFMVMCILSKVRKSESDCFSVQNVKNLSSVYDLLACENSRPSRETPLGPGAKKDGCFRRLMTCQELN